MKNPFKTHKIIYLSPDSLKPYSGNPRTHSREQVQQISRSIQRFGFIAPVVVDERNVLIAGHGRLLAAREIGLRRIPAVRVEHLSPEEKRAYLLADNKLTENAGWDPGLLKVELQYLSSLEFDLETTGFSVAEIDLALGMGVVGAPEPPIPALPDVGACTVKSGDLWQLGPHRLICGDTRDGTVAERLMERQQAQMVFTDPPYNVAIPGHARKGGRIRHENFAMASGEMSEGEFSQFLSESLGSLGRACANHALAYVCMDWRHMHEMLLAGRKAFSELINVCVWAKTSGGMGGLYRSQHELIFVFRHGQGRHQNNVQLGKFGRNRTNVWQYPGANSFGAGREDMLSLHPTVKPVRLVADAILDVTRRGDIVLDGFAGSGSTLMAADQTGRVFRGIELDPRYVEVCLRRWAEATGESPINMTNGRKFKPLHKKLKSAHKEASHE